MKLKLGDTVVYGYAKLGTVIEIREFYKLLYEKTGLTQQSTPLQEIDTNKHFLLRLDNNEWYEKGEIEAYVKR